MNMIPWNPWRETEQMMSRANRMMDELIDKMQGQLDQEIRFLPEADLIETRNEYRIYLSLPGILEDDIDILVDGNQVIVRGERFCPHDIDCADRSTVERRFGFFERHFQFEQPIQSFRAACSEGVLVIVAVKGDHRD